ncbi:hypothetical protein BK652_10010 [Pseudomonas brassicacearum]|uniref:DUF4406 domain-containing protein n=1 Tax=Pseudomonas brassicacearum TaxID=930166 RepID=A0A423GDJ2_9PSED|nr:DUF4406 domain-containing protein [Pseudomonas brassicacearum]ROM84903.1 hypothetical protein BK652_10010 [Pseudomonas brassicacearum]
MPTENRIDCPALRKRSNIYPFGERVPRTVRMLKTVTADPMPGVGLAYIRGDMPVATAGQSYPVWTNSHGAVAAVMPDGKHLGLRPAEFEVDTWHDLSPAPADSGVILAAARANRLYLAGPMTGFEDFNFPAFNKMAADLRAQGYVVENPAAHGVVDGADWADYMAYDLTRLGLCGQVAVLPGWENSKGARLEVHIARELGMKVVNAHDLVSMEIAG